MPSRSAAAGYRRGETLSHAGVDISAVLQPHSRRAGLCRRILNITFRENPIRLGDTTKLSQNALSRQRRGARASKSKRVPLPFDVGREGRAAAHHHGHERAERILTESEVHSMIALTTNKRDRVPS